MSDKDVVVGRVSFLVKWLPCALHVDDKDLSQGPRHALAQLIRSVEHRVQPDIVLGIVCAVGERWLIKLLGTELFYGVNAEGVVSAPPWQVAHLSWRAAGFSFGTSGEVRG
eukprot:scaffold1239_cov175-Pinguiococcus_pyrenoidosus.AAC.9